MWKDFFYFSKRERQGIFVLIVFVVGIFVGKFLFSPKALPAVEEMVLSEEQEGVSGEMNTEENRFNTSNYSSSGAYRPYQQRGRQQRYQRDQRQETRTYYQQPEKVQEIPLTKNYPQTEKLEAGAVIDVNLSDTTQLMKIPGIGASFAKRIVSYRNLLGGFYRIEQIQEVYGMYEELYAKITPYMYIGTNELSRIPVNNASVEKLKAHPYLNFYQAKAIVEIRKKKGKLEGINELSLLEEFTGEDLDRIRPYLAFETTVNGE
jgi:competence ComEA-like helix-hairpin-helix protein